MSDQPKTFIRQFLELISGTLAAQTLSLLLMPVISRLYSPHEMGDYALYVAISSIIGGVANLRLDQAVVLAGDDDEGARLVWLGVGISFLIGTLSFPILFLFQQSVSFNFMTSLTITAVGSLQAVIYWHNRKSNYQKLGTRMATEKLIVLIFGIGLGWIGYTRFGLIAAQTIGCTYSLAFLIWVSRLHTPRFAKALWRETFVKFSDFPRRNFFSQLLTYSSMFIPSVLFAALYTKEGLGEYNLATRVLEIPLNLIGYSFQLVYFRRTSLDPNRRLELFWRSMRWMVGIFGPGFLVLALIAPTVFGLAFGANWSEAGEIASWLTPVTAVRLFFVSQCALLFVQRKLNLDLLISFFLFIAQVGGVAIGYYGFHSFHASIIAMSALGTIVYLSGLVAVYRVAKT